MRILHVVPTYAPAWRYGGPIHAVHGLCRALGELGHEVHVFTTSVDGSGDLDVPRDRPVNRDGVSVNYFPSRILRRIYWSPAMGAALRSRIGEFDLVHAHSVFLWPTWRAARAASACGRPLILSPRGMLVPELIAAKSAWTKRCWIRLIERRNLRSAAAIHVTSSAEARDLARCGLALAPVSVVPNGVDLPSAAEGSAPRDPRSIAFLGRINWKKGLDRLIRAMAMVPDVSLTIAGNDEENLRPDLERLVRECAVAERVTFIGSAEGGAKRRLLEQASVLVLPSLSENFGNVVVEAMAHGCPVIVTPEVGAAEIVEACDGGLVSSGDPIALATAIRALIEHPARARAMGERGQTYVRGHLSWKSVAARMVEAYAAAIASADERVARAV